MTDLVKEMMFWCRHIDPEFEHSPYPQTRWAGDGTVEVSYCCRNDSGTEICGDYSSDPDVAMQSLIDTIREHLFSSTTHEERMGMLYRLWIKDAIC